MKFADRRSYHQNGIMATKIDYKNILLKYYSTFVTAWRISSMVLRGPGMKAEQSGAATIASIGFGMLRISPEKI
jgi:hypothetical protein